MRHYPEIEIRAIPFRTFKEYHLTINKSGVDKAFLTRIFAGLKKRKIKISKFAYLGNLKILPKELKSANDYPTLAIGNSPRSDNPPENASIYINALGGDLKRFMYIKTDKKVLGTYFDCQNFEHLSLSGLCDAGSAIKSSFKDEAKNIYKKIDAVLSQNNFFPNNIFRFWNYLTDVSENYASFNKIRDDYYIKRKIIRFPAATGIEAGLLNGKRINVSLEAIKPKREKAVEIKIVKSQRQCEAWEYGPKFSRAVLVTFAKDNIKKLYVSGTSSVNWRGESILKNKCGENIVYVMTCIEHLLNKNGMSFDNLVMSHIYFKSSAIYDKFRRIYTANAWDFPYNPVFVNICRDNFFFEMECIAANKFDTIKIVPRVRTRGTMSNTRLLFTDSGNGPSCPAR